MLGLLWFSAGNLKAEEIQYDAFNIVTSPGENASTEMNINYHTHNEVTSLEYTLATDSAYLNKQIITGELREFESLSTPEHLVELDFTKRNIVSVYLENLTPGTEYRYRINKGDGTYTADYTFQTADLSPNTSFLFVTDGHVWSSPDVKYDTVITKALQMDPSLGFVLTTGDMVDKGGNSSYWENLFTGTTNLAHLPMIGTPGNHEYYHYGVGETDARYFNAFFNSPKNGPAKFLNSTSFFVYNNVLFVQLDTVKKNNMDEQIKWFEDVVENNPAEYIVVGAHKPFDGYAESWFPVFERYAVDLVLTGHSHNHRWQPNQYLGSAASDANLGVTYLTGDGAGDKSDTGTGYLFQITGDVITVTRYDDSGLISVKTLASKRPDTHETLSKEDFMNSLMLTKDDTAFSANFTWSNKAYQNVKKIDFKDNFRGLDQKVYMATPSHTFLNLTGLKHLYEYKYTASVTFSDGTMQTKDFNFDFGANSNPKVTLNDQNPKEATLEWTHDETIPSFKYYEIYLNDQLYKEVSKFDDNFKTTWTLTSLASGKTYDIKLIAYDSWDKPIFDESLSFSTPKAPGCLSGATLPFTILLGLSALASACFLTFRKKA